MVVGIVHQINSNVIEIENWFHSKSLDLHLIQNADRMFEWEVELPGKKKLHGRLLTI